MFLIFRAIKEKPESIELTPDEVRHTKALRLRPGDPLYLGDGISRRWKAKLTEDGRTALIEDNPDVFRESELHLYTAVPEKNRWDWLLQKASEIGATHIIPLLCAYSQNRNVSLDRGGKILSEAASQARRYFLPVLNEITPLQKLKIQWDHSVFLEPGSSTSLSEASEKQIKSIFIGPEGGFSKDEIQFFTEHGALPVRLGHSILRVETAALCALAVCASRR